MEVGDLLPRALAGVGDDAVALLFQAELGGDFIGGDHQLTEQGGVGFLRVLQAFQMGFGDDQHVHRGLGGDVVEGEDLVVFIHLGAGDFAAEDFAEDGGVFIECVTHGVSLLQNVGLGKGLV